MMTTLISYRLCHCNRQCDSGYFSIFLQDICKYLIKMAGNNVDLSPENIYHIVSAWKALGTCEALPTAALSKVNEIYWLEEFL